MTAGQLLQDLAQGLYFAIFILTARTALQRPTRTNINAALFFGAAVLVIGSALLAMAVAIPSRVQQVVEDALILTMPYLLVRVLHDFIGVRPRLMRLTKVGLVAAVASLILSPLPPPFWLTFLLVAYFFGLEIYVAVQFARGTRWTNGVTRARVLAMATGSGCLGLVIVSAGLEVLVPSLTEWWSWLSDTSSVLSGVAYYLGFVPPNVIRRGWQERDVRTFLRTAARLPVLDDPTSIVRTLETGVATAVGARYTSIRLWDERSGVLHFYPDDSRSSSPQSIEVMRAENLLRECFDTRQTTFIPNMVAAGDKTNEAMAVVAVPITAGKTRLGVLAVSAPRAFIFADDDLNLIQMLADQIALTLGYARELAEHWRAEAEILARKRVEETLRASEEVKSAILTSALDAIITMDQTGVITDFNPAAERIFGYSRSDVVGRSLADTVIPPSLREAHRAGLRRYLATGDGRVLNTLTEVTAMRADQTEFPAEIAIACLSTKGPPLFTGFVHDLTVRNAAQAAQIRLTAMVQSSEDAIYSVTARGEVTSWNPAAERLFGYTAEEMLGQSMSRLIPPDRLAEMVRVVESLERGAASKHFETVRIRKDLSRVDVAISISALHGTEGHLVGTASIARDMTRRMRSQAQIRALNGALRKHVLELQAANNELEAFSYSVSHDLRAPLRAINGFSRIVLEEFEKQLSPEAHEYLALIRDNAQQMGRLIDDLLSFSRLNRQGIEKDRVLPSEIVEHVLHDLAPELESRSVDVVLGELPSCLADQRLLRQVFFNLISNALKFTRVRAVARIEVGSVQTNDEVVFFVKDNGAGFDMRYAHKLFGVFQRLHRAEDFEGTGVGLAIVQRIVDRHGGRIWAEGVVDQGATFSFTLERAHIDAASGSSEKHVPTSYESPGQTFDNTEVTVSLDAA